MVLLSSGKKYKCEMTDGVKYDTLTQDREFVINLDGPDGNAFQLMNSAKRFVKDMSLETHGDYP